MESSGSDAESAVQGLELRLFGPLRLLRDGVWVKLPPSRKVRALMAYLAVSPHPVSRQRLCTLLWEVPDDPRGELRWCLSKLRRLLDEPGRPRVVALDDRVSLDLDGCDVDALHLISAARAGLDRLAQRALPSKAWISRPSARPGTESGTGVRRPPGSHGASLSAKPSRRQRHAVRRWPSCRSVNCALTPHAVILAMRSHTT